MRVQELVDPKLTGSRPPILINSIPLPTRLERENILHEREFEPVLPYLLDAGKSLENAGADFVVLACNSLHIFEKQISESISRPFLSMVKTTVEHIVSEDIDKVGLLGTYKTKSSGMYTRALESEGIETVQTSEEEQKLLGKMIVRLIDGSYGPEDQVLLKSAVTGMVEQGADRVILACTDLHLVADFEDTDMGAVMVDTMDILAQRSAAMIMS